MGIAKEKSELETANRQTGIEGEASRRNFLGNALKTAGAAAFVGLTAGTQRAEAKTTPIGVNENRSFPVAPEDRYLTPITRSNATIVLVDFLTGFIPYLKSVPDMKVFRQNVEAYAQIGKIFKMPTIIVGDEGSFRGNFFPEILRVLPDVPRIPRHTPSAWAEPAFVKAVKAAKRPKLVLGGISIDNCTLHTALGALKDGFEVYIVTDVSGADSQLAEMAAMMRLTQAGATMVNWGSLAAEILGDWQTPEGKAIGELYMKYSPLGNSLSNNDK